MADGAPVRRDDDDVTVMVMVMTVAVVTFEVLSVEGDREMC